MGQKRDKKTNRRYYLHRVIKKQGVSYSAQKHTVYIPHNQEEVTKQVLALQNEYQYALQTEIV